MSSFVVVSGVPVVAAPEEIDVTNADALRSALLEAAAHGHGTLVVDMTATRFCDSYGLHTLLAVHNRALAEGGELRLVIPDIVRFRIFQITGIDRVIPHAASLDQALAQTPAGGPGARGELTARLTAARGTGCPRSTAVASSPEKPADHVTPAQWPGVRRAGWAARRGCTQIKVAHTSRRPGCSAWLSYLSEARRTPAR